MLREKAKDEEFGGPLRKLGFEEIIKKLNKKEGIPDFDNLLRLNTARNNVEHDNLVPDQADVVSYERTVERFFQWACNNYFGVQYADLVQEQLVAHPEIRQHFINARECLATDRSRFARELANAFVKFVAAIFRYFRAIEFAGGVTIMSGMGNALVDAPALTSLKLLFFRDMSVMNLINRIRLTYPKDDPTKPVFLFDKLVELFNASDDPQQG